MILCLVKVLSVSERLKNKNIWFCQVMKNKSCPFEKIPHLYISTSIKYPNIYSNTSCLLDIEHRLFNNSSAGNHIYQFLFCSFNIEVVLIFNFIKIWSSQALILINGIILTFLDTYLDNRELCMHC